jgi:hypothetical protein
MKAADAAFLEERRKLYEKGHKNELLYCLIWCLQNNVPIQATWVYQKFLEAYFAVTGCEVKSWDDVFGRPLPKGGQLATERRKIEIRWSVYECIRNRHEAGEPLEKLFREVGKDFGIGSTVAKELYYDIKNSPYELFMNRK